jgi:hypothetical protein
VASCILFMAGQGALETHQHAFYWIIKLVAIFLALVASMTLTTVWEEWAIWRLSSRPEGTGFFKSVLRTNLYVLLRLPPRTRFRDDLRVVDHPPNDSLTIVVRSRYNLLVDPLLVPAQQPDLNP